MAVQTGTISAPTDMLNDQELVVDMDPEIRLLDADESQFSTLSMKTKSREATREKVNWLENEYFPRLATVAAGGYLVGATTVNVTAGQGVNFRKYDVVRNMARGDAFWVTAIATDALTVVRNVGVTAAVAGTAGDTLLIMSNASPQGADFGSTAVLVKTLGFNYTQIFRHGYTFSRTASKVELYGQRQPAQESALKGVEHKRAIEYSGFWGARDSKVDAGTGEPVGFCGGLVEYIATFKQNVAGSLTVDLVDTFLKGALQFSSRNVMIFCSPLAAYQMSKFNRGGQGSAWRPSRENVVGVKVDAFMSGVYGYEIPVIVKKDWNDFPTTLSQYGGWLFTVDMDSIQWRPLRDSSTKLLTARQTAGSDRISEEYLTEATWEITNEKHHGIMYGIV